LSRGLQNAIFTPRRWVREEVSHGVCWEGNTPLNAIGDPPASQPQGKKPAFACLPQENLYGRLRLKWKPARVVEPSRACRRHEAGECPPSLDATWDVGRHERKRPAINFLFGRQAKGGEGRRGEGLDKSQEVG